MGDRGRLVVPADIRERGGLVAGTPLVMVETPAGLILMTREQLKRRIRDQLAGHDLVADLLADRRAAAQDEDATA
ncbi:MAG: AbrB/MazE/SpoVT family DNA-binding domain-containing protein [Nocardioides sp.]